jgi:nitrate reductase gamma subunit
MQFWYVSVVPKYLNFATSSKDLFAIFMLRFCFVFWLLHISIYLVFSWFISRLLVPTWNSHGVTAPKDNVGIIIIVGPIIIALISIILLLCLFNRLYFSSINVSKEWEMKGVNDQIRTEYWKCCTCICLYVKRAVQKAGTKESHKQVKNVVWWTKLLCSSGHICDLHPNPFLPLDVKIQLRKYKPILSLYLLSIGRHGKIFRHLSRAIYSLLRILGAKYLWASPTHSKSDVWMKGAREKQGCRRCIASPPSAYLCWMTTSIYIHNGQLSLLISCDKHIYKGKVMHRYGKKKTCVIFFI